MDQSLILYLIYIGHTQWLTPGVNQCFSLKYIIKAFQELQRTKGPKYWQLIKILH